MVSASRFDPRSLRTIGQCFTSELPVSFYKDVYIQTIFQLKPQNAVKNFVVRDIIGLQKMDCCTTKKTIKETFTLLNQFEGLNQNPFVSRAKHLSTVLTSQHYKKKFCHPMHSEKCVLNQRVCLTRNHMGQRRDKKSIFNKYFYLNIKTYK